MKFLQRFLSSKNLLPTGLAARLLCVISLFLFSALSFSTPAQATVTGVNCTSTLAATQIDATNSGIVTAVITEITNILKRTSEGLYKHIIDHPYYQAALTATVLLTVIIYGIMIVFDLANLKPGEIMTRVFKLGMVAWIASPSGWELINEIIAKFFFFGMAELINLFLLGAVQMSTTASSGGVNSIDIQQLAAPLNLLGQATGRLFSAKYGTTMLGLPFVGTQGLIMALMMLWAGYNLLLALFQAIFVYVKSIVGLWFMFSLAPIFIICLLYKRTESLFQGWLNMVINFTLQPILLFAFFAFFIVMTSASLGNILKIEWCEEVMEDIIFWFDLTLPRPRSGFFADGAYWEVPEKTHWTISGANQTGLGGLVQFPIETIDMLFFLLSAYLGLQYANFVPQLASQLSQNGMAIGASLGDTREFFSARGLTPETIATRGIDKAMSLGR